MPNIKYLYQIAPQSNSNSQHRPAVWTSRQPAAERRGSLPSEGRQGN